MRNLLVVCAGLVVLLGIVSGNLWRELRASRQEIAELRAQMGLGKTSDPGSAQVQVSQPASETKEIPVVTVQIPNPMPVAPVAQPAPVSTPLNPVVTRAIKDVLRAEVLAQSERTATARVLAWKDRLTIAGQTLTTAQLQTLNTAAITELRREAEESLELENVAEPTDAEAVARLREESINRQNETNLRILKTVSPQMSPELISALRTMFEAGDAQRRATARADRERAAGSGN